MAGRMHAKASPAAENIQLPTFHSLLIQVILEHVRIASVLAICSCSFLD